MSAISSIIQAQALVATPGGALVGYADAQFPPVDSSWHVRAVSFGDAALGSDFEVLQRNASGLGWTAISIAAAGARVAATASDETQGMQFVSLDSSGSPAATPVTVPGLPGRFMLATASGYSVLRNAFDPSGGDLAPLSFASLDESGAVLETTELLGASTPLVQHARAPLPDGSFVLFWTESPAGCACRRVRSRHFGADGKPLADAATLHTFGQNDFATWVATASSSTLLLAWTERTPHAITLTAQPFEVKGTARGAPRRFADFAGENPPTLAIAPAPGGDFIAAWAGDAQVGTGQVFVQSVDVDGAAEGESTLVADGSLSEDDGLRVVASPLGGMVIYASDVGQGIEVFAVPLRCNN